MTTTLTIYRLTAMPDKLFAHFIQSPDLNLNGVLRLDAERVFLAMMESSDNVERDRKNIQQFALSGLIRFEGTGTIRDEETDVETLIPLKPKKMHIEWDDTHVVWDM